VSSIACSFQKNKFQNMVNVGAEMLKNYQKEKKKEYEYLK